MGSDSDWPVMKAAATALEEFGVPFEADVVSAHRMPEEMLAYGKEAAGRGLRVIIAGAGGAAHLPGMLASVTPLPVIGVPVPLEHLDGLDSLLSIVQMPAGVPVATVAVGNARNAGLLAVRILAASDEGAARSGWSIPGRAAGDRAGQGRGGPQRRRAAKAGLLSEPRARGWSASTSHAAWRCWAWSPRTSSTSAARTATLHADQLAGRWPGVGAVRGAGRREPGADARGARPGSAWRSAHC